MDRMVSREARQFSSGNDRQSLVGAYYSSINEVAFSMTGRGYAPMAVSGMDGVRVRYRVRSARALDHLAEEKTCLRKLVNGTREWRLATWEPGGVRLT
jgi:hypothetical protein